VPDFLDFVLVTIPGRGDLAPRRRHYHPIRWLAAVVVIGLIALASYAGYRHFNGRSSSPARVTTLPLCKTAAPVGPPPPGKVHLTVLNGTLTSGLAAEVAKALQHRGFHVAKVGNTQKLATGIATISYGPGKFLPAQTLADHITGAKLVKGTAAGVQLAIGPRYRSLASASAAAAARTRFMGSYLGIGRPSPSITPSPTCRPRPS